MTLVPLVIAAGSAGSLEAIFQMVLHLPPKGRFAFLIVLHRKQDSDSSLTQLLQSKSSWPVTDADEKQRLQPGWIYLCPADYHLLLEQDGTLSLDASEKVNFSRPSIDVIFESAAALYDTNLMCILLSGANKDGVDGMVYAVSRGARVLVQAPSEAPMPFMPLQAIIALEGKAEVMSTPDMIHAIHTFNQSLNKK